MLGLILCGPSAWGQDAAAQQQAVESRLREALRAATQQARTLESERAQLQAAQAENETKLKELGARVEALAKQGEEDRRMASEAERALHARLAAKEQEAALLKENLAKWQKSQQKAAAAAAAKEAERAGLARQVILLQRRIDGQQAKNIALHELAREILDRYASFGLGTALTAREPFTGITRVKLQNLAEDFGDKIDAQRIKLPSAEEGAAPEQPSKN